MAISCFRNPQRILVAATGVLTGNQPDIGRKLFGRREALEISCFNNGGQSSTGFYTEETAQFSYGSLISIIFCKLFNAPIQTFQPFSKRLVGR